MKPFIKWADLKWRKYNIIQRASQKATASVNMPAQSWFEQDYTPISCYGYFCERKSLRLWCLLHCCGRKECKAQTKKIQRSNILMCVLLAVNVATFCWTPNFANGSAALVIIGSAIFSLIRMFKETKKTLAWIDRKPKEEGPY